MLEKIVKYIFIALGFILGLYVCVVIATICVWTHRANNPNPIDYGPDAFDSPLSEAIGIPEQKGDKMPAVAHHFSMCDYSASLYFWADATWVQHFLDRHTQLRPCDEQSMPNDALINKDMQRLGIEPFPTTARRYSGHCLSLDKQSNIYYSIMIDEERSRVLIRGFLESVRD
ncbi:MAG: hypothetical protein R3Y56_09485 [Akkermansia sp.]